LRKLLKNRGKGVLKIHRTPHVNELWLQPQRAGRRYDPIVEE
jgi:hypothetical protein